MLVLNVSLKTNVKLEQAVVHLTRSIQQAAQQATPDVASVDVQNKCSLIIKQKIAEKRKIKNSGSSLDQMLTKINLTNLPKI